MGKAEASDMALLLALAPPAVEAEGDSRVKNPGFAAFRDRMPRVRLLGLRGQIC
jgi:hypothetical protein